ncbi:MAG: tetrahydrofolate dehydrogenase/cyclohydrolase catalytic domain-containing protein, partial [Sphingobacterium sp.]
MNLLDGKLVSEKIKEQIALDAAEFTTQTGRKPHLVAILVGNDGGSETYVASKMRNCQLVGFESTNIRYDESISEEELIAKVKEINKDDTIDGLIVQLPLPKHIDPDKITEAIDYRKDVDGFHPIN